VDFVAAPAVDTFRTVPHPWAIMSRRPIKLEEPAGTYGAAPPAPKAVARVAASAAPVPKENGPSFQQITDKIFAERKKLLRRLAQ